MTRTAGSSPSPPRRRGGALARRCAVLAAPALLAGLLALSSVAAAPERPRLHVAPAGSDTAPCTSAAPCASLDRAYRLAAPGQVVELAAGAYPAQRLRFDEAKTAGDEVVFQPAPGASVRLAGFSTGDTRRPDGARHFELRDVIVDGVVRLRWGTEDVTLRGVDAAGLVITSARDVRVLGGDYGPMIDGVSHINACGVPGCFPAEDVLIDGALFHDYTVTDPAKHSECLLIWPGRRVTIRRSTFRNCTDFDILVKPYNTALVGLPGEITIENSVLDDPIVGDDCRCRRGGNAIAFTAGSGERWAGAVARYNSALGGIRVDPEVTGAVVEGNVARKDSRSSCQPNVRFAHNVWSGVACAATDRRSPLEGVFASAQPGAFDARPRRGSAAVGGGSAETAPAVDYGGRLRPLGLAADAGAWQLEPAGVFAGRSVGSARIGMRRADVRAIYGAPRARAVVRLGDGGGATLEEHRVRGGRVRLWYRSDLVVAAGTTSSFYRTPAGLAVGTSVREAAPGEGCRRAASGLWLRTAPSRRSVLAELVVVRPGLRPACTAR